ncbi:PLP-dependent transferase [Dentipellis sp. KUC8613]|nr:PLP-dependent transferase [Dentipellis sp. KUC8613]
MTVTVNGAEKAKVLPASFYDRFLSTACKERKPSPIRSLFPLEKEPGVISLLAGKPNSATFPIDSIKLSSRLPTDPTKEIPLTIEGETLAEALQYSATAGIPSLVKWLTGLQEAEHRRKQGEGWRLSVASGSQDAFYKATTAVLNPGDVVLVETPAYAGVIPVYSSLHVEMIEVPTDEKGIRSDVLRSILENWPASKPKPKTLYTVPYGSNPTGYTATVERRLEVLELSRQHDFLIFEDDPYYYLYYGKAARPPSYFSLEAQTGEIGRVLRFDSLSKILSAGIRIGFTTGPTRLLNAMDDHTAQANLQVSSLTQAITFSVLNAWGYDNFIIHTQNTSQFYRQKRDIFAAAMRKHLDGLAEWNIPEAGMFFWFKLLLHEDPNEVIDSDAVIRGNAFKGGVLALPGNVFLPSGAATGFVRASFSLLGEDEVDEALRRLRVVLLKEREGAAKAN